MRTFLLWAAVFALVCGALATNTVTVSAAEPTEFKDGWNTWETAKKGDSVEYKFASGMVKKYEVTQAAAGRLSVKTTMIPPGGGDQVVSESKDQDWRKVGMISGKVPADADWSAPKEKRTVGTVEVECELCSWTVGATSNTNYYSKNIPCGGVVCCVSNGQERVWLTKWTLAGKEFGEAKVELPKFYRKAGHKAMYSEIKKAATRDAEPATYKLLEINKVDEKDCRVIFTESPCDKDGKVTAPTKAVQSTKDAQDLTKPYSKPEMDGKNVKTEKITAGGQTYTCKIVKTEERKATESSEYIVKTTTWITDFGLIVKQIVDSGGDTVTTELITENSGLQK